MPQPCIASAVGARNQALPRRNFLLQEGDKALRAADSSPGPDPLSSTQPTSSHGDLAAKTTSILLAHLGQGARQQPYPHHPQPREPGYQVAMKPPDSLPEPPVESDAVTYARVSLLTPGIFAHQENEQSLCVAIGRWAALRAFGPLRRHAD